MQDEFEVPGFAEGGLVKNDGIALVHAGEYIGPAPGSEAMVTPLGGQVVNYHFPVEIQAVGPLPAKERDRLADQMFGRISQELAARL